MLEQSKLIAVVEDDPGMRKALDRLLRAAGYKTELFPSAEALMATETPHLADCLIFDIHLPGISGLELRRRLTASGHKPPVIFITALDDEAARDEARRPADRLPRPHRAVDAAGDSFLRAIEPFARTIRHPFWRSIAVVFVSSSTANAKMFFLKFFSCNGCERTLQ